MVDGHIESINGLIGRAARVVRSCWNLFAYFGCAWLAIALWNYGFSLE
jgi:hypothetical protein